MIVGCTCHGCGESMLRGRDDLAVCATCTMRGVDVEQ